MLGDLYFRAIVDHFAKLINNETAAKLEKVEGGVDANWSSEDFTEYADLSRVLSPPLPPLLFPKYLVCSLIVTLGPLQCWPTTLGVDWAFDNYPYSLRAPLL